MASIDIFESCSKEQLLRLESLSLVAVPRGLFSITFQEQGCGDYGRRRAENQ